MADPKLKEAMAEVIGILQKHDIGGDILLISETYSEFRYQLSPSWSAATLNEDGLLQVRAMRNEFKTKEEQFRVIDLTVHLIKSIYDHGIMSQANAELAINMMSQHVVIDLEPPEIEPHRSN